jgi:glycosyltransferase involved in cell wall biosynthesis
VPYKRIDLIIDAFASLPEKRLVVFGDGPDFAKLAARAGPNVTLMGHQPFANLRDHMQRARAFIFAAEEDFGITPLEAQACGTPVIAFGRGGARETILGLDSARPTGVFFAEQSIAALLGAIHQFETEAARILPSACRENAQRFSIAAFREAFAAFVANAWAAHCRDDEGKGARGK